MTKWPVQNQTQTHRIAQKHQDATDIQKKNYFGVFRFFVIYL